MNILYLAHRIPYPPDKGDKMRSYRQLAHLAGRHRVWCACFVDDPADGPHVAKIKELCVDVAAIRLRRKPATVRGLWALAGGGTITESFYRSSAMDRVLRRWGESLEFDAVVAFSSGMAPYALSVPAGRKVLDLCDLDSRKWLDYAARTTPPFRWLYACEGRRLAKRERAWIQAFDAALIITSAEAEHLGDTRLRQRVHVVGNGVSLPSSLDIPQGVPVSPKSGGIVGFVGMMNYTPNVDAVCWFVSTIWPLITRACPDARFRIVGRSPTRRVRRLGSALGVEVVGGVDDIAEELERFDVSVAPLRIARGLQNKVLEAMAWAKPVVLTSQAAEGIEASHEREYCIADRPTQIADTVIELLRDPARRARLGQAARRFVASHHRWEDVLRRFELIVTESVEGAGGPHPSYTLTNRSCSAVQNRSVMPAM